MAIMTATDHLTPTDAILCAIGTALLLGYDSVAQAVGSMRVEGLRWEDIQILETLDRLTPSVV